MLRKKTLFFLGQTPMKIWFRCAAEVFFSGNDIFSFQDPATPRRSFWAPNNSGITKAQNETTANVRFPSTFYTAIDISWLVLSSYTLGLFNSKIKKKSLKFLIWSVCMKFFGQGMNVFYLKEIMIYKNGIIFKSKSPLCYFKWWIYNIFLLKNFFLHLDYRYVTSFRS